MIPFSKPLGPDSESETNRPGSAPHPPLSGNESGWFFLYGTKGDRFGGFGGVEVGKGCAY